MAVFVVIVLATTALAQTTQKSDNWPSVHDPAVLKQGDTYYLFSTGRGVLMHTSKDLVHWTRIGQALDDVPAWTAELWHTTGDLWAPDIVLVDGQYRLYYTVSSFGSNRSAIGLATNSTLDAADPKYNWVDQGIVARTQKSDYWNAIDSAAFVDQTGQHWMAVGSFWSGLKLFKLDAATGKPVAGDRPRAIAARPGNTAIEAAFVTVHDGFYYLWSSFDKCCVGSDSTYNTRVGRSKSPEGPYVDREGKPLLEGGGSVVIRGHENVRGPGHVAVLRDGATDYLVHHWYDAERHGRPSLAVRPIVWEADGWPLVGEVLAGPKGTYDSPAGAWLISTDFADYADTGPAKFTADADGHGGKIDSDRGTWTLSGDTMTLRYQDRKAPGEQRVDTVTLSADRSWFVGRNQTGVIIRGRRDVP